MSAPGAWSGFRGTAGCGVRAWCPPPRLVFVARHGPHASNAAARPGDGDDLFGLGPAAGGGIGGMGGLLDFDLSGKMFKNQIKSNQIKLN